MLDGIDANNMMKTVTDCNDCKKNGGKNTCGVPSDYMVGMSTAPYNMSLFDPSINTNALVGLKTNEYCRILNNQGESILGLYGTGGLIVGNICAGAKEDGPCYSVCGTCLAASICGSPIAVRHAIGNKAMNSSM